MNKILWLYSLWVSFICAVFFFLYGYTGLTIGWMSFIILAVYFGMGCKVKDAPAIFCNIIAGLIWGQLDYVFINLMNTIGLSSVAGMFIGITLMTTIAMGLHLTVLGNTMLNKLPFIFVGVALTFSQSGNNEAGLAFTLVSGLLLALVCSLGEIYILAHFTTQPEDQKKKLEVKENA
jgi:apolipoprotein N-acyltransferase